MESSQRVSIVKIENVKFHVDTICDCGIKTMNPCLIDVFVSTNPINEGEIINAFDDALGSFGQDFGTIRNKRNENYLKALKQYIDKQYQQYIDYFAEFTINDIASIIKTVCKNTPHNWAGDGFNFTFLLSVPISSDLILFSHP
jgi:lysophospholipase L1-like esterase